MLLFRPVCPLYVIIIHRASLVHHHILLDRGSQPFNEYVTFDLSSGVNKLWSKVGETCEPVDVLSDRHQLLLQEVKLNFLLSCDMVGNKLLFGLVLKFSHGALSAIVLKGGQTLFNKVTTISRNIEAAKATFCLPVHYRVMYTFSVWTIHSLAYRGPSISNSMNTLFLNFSYRELGPLSLDCTTTLVLTAGCVYLSFKFRIWPCIAVWASLCLATCSFIALCCLVMVYESM